MADKVLLETGDVLLLETGDALLLESSGAAVDVTVTISGVESTAAVGDIAVGGDATVSLTGVESAGAVGALSIAGDATVTLTGVEATPAVGDLAASSDVSVNITGVAAASGVGSLSVQVDATVTLTGVSATGAVGSLRGRTTSSPKWLATARIFLDDGTENIGSVRVIHPARTYEATVLRWGSIESSIPIPSGMPQASRMGIRVDDTGLRWRNTMGSQTPEGRRIQVKAMAEGASEAAADIIFTGLIDGFLKGPGYLEIYATSNMLSWLDDKLPEVITQENFSEFPDVKQQYFPLWLGHVVGRAVSLGVAAGAPAGPSSGALVDNADAADVLRAEIVALTFSTGPFSVFLIALEWSGLENRYNQALALITGEFESQYAAGVLDHSDAVYARGKLQDLLDDTDDKASEFAAIDSGRAGIVAQWRSKVTSFFGADWERLLAEIDAKIAAISGSPPAETFAPQGAARLPHIGFLDGVGDRWGGAITPLWNVLAIYRKLPDESVFTPVDPAEFDVTVQAREFGEYPDVTFNCTFIDFILQQPEGTDVQMDADGAYYRGEFGAMPAVGYAPGEGLSDLGPLRNPVDAMLLMREWLFPKAGGASSFDVTALTALRVKLRDGGATVPALMCDGVVAESLTPRELLGRFNTSFQTDLFETNDGLISMARVDDTDDLRPVLTESVIVRNTFIERSPETFNRFRAQYAYDYSLGNWTALALADNLVDQVKRGKIQDDKLGLWFVRDALTAQAAVYDRLRYTDTGSYLQRLDAPLRAVSSFLDLARLIGITHKHGMLISGYRNREVKIVGKTIDLDAFRVTIDSVVRAPLRFGAVKTCGLSSGALAGSTAEADAVIIYCAEDDFELYTPGNFHTVAAPPWSVVNGSSQTQIDSGKIRVESGTDFFAAYLANCGSTALDQEAQMVFADMSSSGDDTGTLSFGFGPSVRMSQTAGGVYGDSYTFAIIYVKTNLFNRRLMTLVKHKSGSGSTIATVNIDGSPPVNGEVFRIAVHRVGSNDDVVCYRGGSAVITQTVTSGLPAAGYPGFRKTDTGGVGTVAFYQRWEEFHARNL